MQKVALNNFLAKTAGQHNLAKTMVDGCIEWLRDNSSKIMWDSAPLKKRQQGIPAETYAPTCNIFNVLGTSIDSDEVYELLEKHFPDVDLSHIGTCYEYLYKQVNS